MTFPLLIFCNNYENDNDVYQVGLLSEELRKICDDLLIFIFGDVDGLL